jgi:steroid 5-alpha reductase family enzyme
MESLLLFAIISIGLNVMLFIPAYVYKTDKLTDISYALTFVVIALISYWLGGYDVKKIVLLALVLTWAVRLGYFLLNRIHKMNKDDRFDGIRESFLGFLGFWLLQGITVFILSSPIFIFMTQTELPFNNDYVWGTVIAFMGLVIESIADRQKSIFKENPKNSDQWIESGLWKYIRHPNYLGELMVWIGVYLFTMPYLNIQYNIIALSSPIFIFLMLRYVSGIPLLEKRYKQKFKDNPQYSKYVERTGRFIPKLNKLFK